MICVGQRQSLPDGPSLSFAIRETECEIGLDNPDGATGSRNYFATFRVMVFETTFPILGFTVTVTLQDPAFKPRSDVPDTLQIFEALDSTFNETFDVERTENFAYAAIDLYFDNVF
jgi:8-oxo-dGTP pyrophosphatase MutT (NUDIX family)